MYFPRANGIQFSLKDFNDLMSLKDIISSAFAYAGNIPEINLEHYRQNLNIRARINIPEKYLKLWYQNQENLTFKIYEQEWAKLTELSDHLMYKMLPLNFKDVNFRSAFEALVEPVFSESHTEVWRSCKDKLYNVIKEYFLRDSFPRRTEPIEMTYFVTSALEMDICSIVQRFCEVIGNCKTVAIDFLDSVDFGDLIQEACEELCDIKYY